MTLLELLQKAEALAREGHLDGKWFCEKRGAAEKAERSLALTQTYVESYKDMRSQQRLDGTTLALDRARTAQQLLVSARSEARLYSEALAFLQEEVEMAILKAEHRKAAKEQRGMHA